MFYYVVILLFNLLFNQQKHVDKGELLMSNLTLWDQLKEAKSEKYKWVDLTHELSPETPHWYGFSPLFQSFPSFG